jgi:hypothetical protein
VIEEAYKLYDKLKHGVKRFGWTPHPSLSCQFFLFFSLMKNLATKLDEELAYKFPRVSVQDNPSPTTCVVPPLPMGEGFWVIDFI